MSEPSILIVGVTGAGRALAGALARRGADVAIVGPDTPDATDRDPLDGVDVRDALTLVGALDVDTHIEAELSDGRIENYDTIVIATPERPPGVTPGSRVRVVQGDAEEFARTLLGPAWRGGRGDQSASGSPA